MARDLEKRALELQQVIDVSIAAGKIAQAVAPAKELVELRQRSQGTSHWETTNARWQSDALQRLSSRPQEDQSQYVKALWSTQSGEELFAQGKYNEAKRLFQESLEICRRVLGEDFPQTVTGYNNVAETLRAQHKYLEAEAMHRKALAIRIKARGEEHPGTATSYNNLAETLRERREYAEAEATHRKALAIYLKVFGPDDLYTAISQNNLGRTLQDQCKYAEAEAVYRKALAVRLEALGPDDADTAASAAGLARSLQDQGKLIEAEALHRQVLASRLKTLGRDDQDTSTSYNNLANVLRAQGKFAEAEAMHRESLAISLKVLGRDDPERATSYNNLAVVLRAQGKFAEAEAMHREDLAICLEILGPDDPDTATTLCNLGSTLQALGRHAEAEAILRQALMIRRKRLGEDHPDTAFSYNNLAESLVDQHRYAESELLHRSALAVRVRTLGEDHPVTAASHNNLAWVLDLAGKSDEALRSWEEAASCYELTRRNGYPGLESALVMERTPLSSLTLALIRAARPLDAWTRWEQGLARGVLDETVGRASRPLTTEERRVESDLLGRSQALDEQTGRILAQKHVNQQDEKRLEDLRREASDIRRQLLELQQQFDARYGALAGKPAALEEVQKVIPEGAALLGWVDTEYRHGVCVLKKDGDPVWVLLPGKGENSAWTEEEVGLAERLRKALDPEIAQDDWRPLAVALAEQRITPLREHLQGLKRLVVVNSPGMAGVPVEVLMTAGKGSEEARITVSYAPSASMFAYLQSKPAATSRPATLLALGDPAYPEPTPEPPAPTPPDHGLFISHVVPNGNADLNGLRAGDVLIAYADKALETDGDLEVVAADSGPKKVRAQCWRAGELRAVELAAGPLGVALDKRPPAQFVLANREAEKVLLGMRRGAWGRLPGTRREIKAVAGLFPQEGVRTILGDEARESTLQAMATAGQLRDYRYLLFACHGKTDPRNAYRSALILAPDPDRSTDPLDTGLDTDGTITAEQIARTWDLDADLVVLSACQSGLGRLAGGEGYLGFSQALFSKGARSLVLSLWKVDDDATALLMTRFYQTLLRQREGLNGPMPKAEALDEAKRWLRNATTKEVGAVLKSLSRGEIVEREVVPSPTSDRPYEHPRYWAAFILVGAPD